MAFKRSWAHVKRAPEPTTFQGKYSLKRTAGMDRVGTECFVIPLDMAAGYSCLPYHSLKKNGDEGFHGSTFNSSKITCKRFDPETGELRKELPLCCKLAQLEKDRLPETDDSPRRALTFSSMRYVFPVLVLSTTETDQSKKPTMKKLSIRNGVSFSFVDIAESSYDEDIKKVVISAMQEAGIIEDPEEMEDEELMEKVAEYISHSIIKITNEKGKSSSIPYQKSFRVIPNTNALIGQTSGETNLIKALCKLLNDGYAPEQLDALYTKAPILREINNQVIDFLALYNDNVDSLVEDWTEEELQKYYDEYVARAAQIEKYKAVNEQAAEEDEDEETEDVSFVGSLDEIEDDDTLNSINTSVVDELEDEDESVDEDDDFEDESEVAEVEEKPVKAKKPSKVAVAAGSVETDEFDVSDLESTSVASSVVEEDEDDDYSMGEDDFGELL